MTTLILFIAEWLYRLYIVAFHNDSHFLHIQYNLNSPLGLNFQEVPCFSFGLGGLYYLSLLTGDI